jgi:hypothetical protein
MSRLLTFDNFFKGLGLVVAVCGLYYALDKRLALMEQKLDYVVETYKDKEVEAKIELAELKDKDKSIDRELQRLSLRLAAILPKHTRIEDEQD